MTRKGAILSGEKNGLHCHVLGLSFVSILVFKKIFNMATDAFCVVSFYSHSSCEMSWIRFSAF